MKDKLREITGRSRGIGYEAMKTQLNRVIVGWVQYFSLASMKTRMAEMDRWLRRRIRMCYWKMWKLPKTREEELRKLCPKMNKESIKTTANSSKGYWRCSKTEVIHKALNNKWFKREGYIMLSDQYAKVYHAL